MSLSDTMTFRRATHADIAAILPMMLHFNAEEGIAFTMDKGSAALAQLVSHPEWGFVQLATIDEQPIGYALVSYGFDIEYGGRDAFLCELFVARAYRGKGLGRALLEVAEASAQDAEVLAMHLLVRPDNVRAREIYDRSGYKVDGRPLMTKALTTHRADPRLTGF